MTYMTDLGRTFSALFPVLNFWMIVVCILGIVHLHLRVSKIMEESRRVRKLNEKLAATLCEKSECVSQEECARKMQCIQTQGVDIHKA